MEVLKGAVADLKQSTVFEVNFEKLVHLHNYMMFRLQEEWESRNCCKSVKSNGRTVTEPSVEHGAVVVIEESKIEVEAPDLTEEKSEVLQHDACSAHVAHHGATKHNDVVALPHGASGVIMEEKQAAHGRQRTQKNCDHQHGASCRHHDAHGAQHLHRDHKFLD